MPHRYLDTLTTSTVKAAQERYGSRASVDRMIHGWDTDGLLGPDEADYISDRDGFYLGTVGETGWPYVQYRGGTPGFLHVLPPRDGHSVLAWADYRGNRQDVSVGNVAASSRVSLFLMDDANRRRLKIMGHAQILDVGAEGHQDPAVVVLAERLTPAPGPGKPPLVERVITVDVHGYDWNCPQHITPRWTRQELAPALADLQAELDRLRAENERLRAERRPPGKRHRTGLTSGPPVVRAGGTHPPCSAHLAPPPGAVRSTVRRGHLVTAWTSVRMCTWRGP